MRCLRCRATLPNQTDPIAFRFAGDVEDRQAKSKRCRQGNSFNPADVSELKHDRPQCRSEPCGQHGRHGCSAQPSRPCRLTCEKSSSAAIFVFAARLSNCLVAARRTRVLVRLAWRWPLLPLWQRDWASGRNRGGRFVTQVVVVISEISASSWAPEFPPPTTTTCLPTNPDASR